MIMIIFLTRDEIRTTLKLSYLNLLNMDIKEIISVFDTDKDDRISLEEYIGIREYFHIKQYSDFLNLIFLL